MHRAIKIQKWIVAFLSGNKTIMPAELFALVPDR